MPEARQKFSGKENGQPLRMPVSLGGRYPLNSPEGRILDW